MKREVEPRRANRLLNPGCVVLVTARHGEQSNFMPAAWVTPVSHDPPLCAVAIAPKRFTHHLIAQSKEFALCIPPLSLAEKVRLAGDMSGADVRDKFAAVGLTPEAAVVVSAPTIAECLGHVECRLIRSFTAGDHTIFLGQAVAAAVDPRAFDETWTLPPDPALRPLHHLGGPWFAALEKRVEVATG